MMECVCVCVRVCECVRVCVCVCVYPSGSGPQLSAQVQNGPILVRVFIKTHRNIYKYIQTQPGGFFLDSC